VAMVPGTPWTPGGIERPSAGSADGLGTSACCNHATEHSSEMILPLRRWHRCQVLALAILLPIAFVFGVLARKPVPTPAGLPPELTPGLLAAGKPVWDRDQIFPKVPVSIRLWGQSDHSGSFTVSFSAPADFIKPDLMVYWIAGNPRPEDILPTNAILLGAFGPAALPLPDQAAVSDGRLVLYSLADAEIVDVSQPIQVRKMNQSPSPP